MFKILLKKELKDFIYSYQCWGCIIILAFVETILLRVSDFQINIWIYLWLSTIGVSQFIFDSYNSDVKQKGTLFLLNLKLNFSKIMIAKMIFAFFIGIVIIFLNFDLVFESLKIYDLLWVFLVYVFASLSMFIISVLSENSEIGGMLLSAGICAFVLFFMYKIDNLFFQLVIILMLIGLLFCYSKKLFTSIIFRQQI